MKKRVSAWDTFKFDTNIKQPFVFRPMRSPWPYRFLLATMKAIANFPTKFFRSQLCLDCNERIVEVPFVLQNLASPAGMRILDFGCTESALSIYLATQGAQVVGVDLRDYDFKHPNFSFQKTDFLNSGFATACFDAIVAVSAVEHCGLDAYGSRTHYRGDLRVMQEFWRVLKPEGSLILTIPFGNRHVYEELRIYDSQQLDELTSGFSILTRQFYRKAPDGAYWLECSEQEAARSGFDPVTGVEGVALLLCERPPEGHVEDRAKQS